MLVFDRVSKAYAGVPAVRDVSREVESARTTVLIGPSGCGKSTLLRLAAGLIRPDSGVVRLDGEDLAAVDLAAARRRMGYVIQDGGLFPHLTARGNVELMPRHVGWDAARRDARVGELRELVRLPEDALARHPFELSGGQRQRVAIMRALVLDPDLLLLDEPLAALDPIIRRELQEDLARIFDELDKTVLLVTHDLGEAAFFADTVVLLREGVIVQDGAAEDLLERPAEPFVEQFVRAQRSPLEGGRP